MKLPIKIKTLIFLTFIVISLCFPLDVKASTTTTNYNYTIQADQKTKVSIQSKISNIENGKYISSYNFVVPFTQYTNLKIIVDSQVLKADLISENKYTLNIPNNLQQDNKLEIEITYDVTNLVESYGNLKNIYLPSTKSTNVNTNFVKISYPYIWGDINYSSISDYELNKVNNNYEITTKEILNEKGAYFSIGNEQYFDFTLDTTIDKKVEEVVVNIPLTENSQEVYFKKKENSLPTILTDKYYNQYAKFVNTEKILLEMQVKNTINKENILVSTKWDDAYYFSQADSIKELSKNLTSELDVYNYINSKYSFSDSEISTDVNLIEISKKKQLNSFEIALLTAVMLKNIGKSSIVVAGFYTGGDNIISANDKVWFWTEYLEENNKLRSMDNAFSLATGYDGYKSIGLNHLKLFYYTDPSVNVSFGSKFVIPSQYKFSAVEALTTSPSLMETLLINTNKDNKTFNSGMDDNLLIEITNTSTKVINISKITINNEIVKDISISKTVDGYSRLLAPDEILSINYPVKSANWSFNGTKDYDIKVYALVMGSENLIMKKNFILNFKVIDLVVIFSWILRLLIALILTIFIYFFVKKYVKKLTKNTNSEKI